MRIGIFGGTFDPIHQGHLLIAEQVSDALGFERVLFVPAGIPPHKNVQSVQASTEDRLRMVEAAVARNRKFAVDTVEIDAGRPMYSVETVGILKERSPENKWYFISGADEVSNLLTWKDPDRLLEEVVMVAATRPGYDLSALEHLAEELKNFRRIVPVECSRVDISATNIRDRLEGGKSIRYLVPEEVYEIIRECKLYETSSERSLGGRDLKRSEVL